MPVGAARGKEIVVRRRPLVAMLLAVLAGLVADRWGYTATLAAASAGAVLLSAAALARHQRARAALLVAAVAAAWLAWGRSHAQRIRHQRAVEAIQARGDTELLLRVDSAPLSVGGSAATDTGASPSFIATVRGGTLHGVRYRVYADDLDAVPSELVRARMEPFPARVRAFPGAFDAADHRERLDVAASGRASEAEVVAPPDRLSPAYLAHAARSRLVERTLRYVRGETGAFLAAVLYGYREGVSAELRARFRDTGTGHLLAISGLHVGLVTGLAWWLLRRAGLGPRAASAGGIAACLLYLALTGGRPSAVRAGVMAVLFLGGFLVGRRSDLLNALACAALLILFHHPPVLTDAGFQLSFVAVLFLSRLGHQLRILAPAAWEAEPDAGAQSAALARGRVRAWTHAVGRRAWGLFLLSVAVWAGLWPLAAYYFKLLAFAGLLLNVIVIPLLPVVLAGGLLVQAAGLCPAGAAGVWVDACTLPARALLALVGRVARDGGLAAGVNPPAVWALALYYAVFAALFARRALGVRAVHLLTAGAAAAACMLTTMQPAHRPPRARITLLDASGGTCAVVEDARGRVAVAGHLPWHGLDIVDYLRFHGRDRLDALAVFPPYRREAADELRAVARQYEDDEPLAVRWVPYHAEDEDRSANEDRVRVLGPDQTGAEVRLRVLRDRGGWPRAWTIRTQGLCAVVTERGWPGQVAWAVREAVAEQWPQVAVLRIRGDEVPAWLLRRTRDDRPDAASRVPAGDAQRIAAVTFVDAPQGRGLPSTLRRRDWGAIRIEAGPDGGSVVRAFDGEEWVPLRRVRPGSRALP